jgi:hypothetical protein
MMAIRRLLSRPLPQPPEDMSGVGGIVQQAIAASPLAPVRAFWDSLRELESWWPLLIPLLLWVFWRTYRRERAAMRAGNGQT